MCFFECCSGLKMYFLLLGIAITSTPFGKNVPQISMNSPIFLFEDRMLSHSEIKSSTFANSGNCSLHISSTPGRVFLIHPLSPSFLQRTLIALGLYIAFCNNGIPSFTSAGNAWKLQHTSAFSILSM